MKTRIISLSIIALLGSFSPKVVAQINDTSVLMTIGDAKISVADFEAIYNKNNGKDADKKSVNDYVDLFVNFRLKVKEAEDLKLDTSRAFKNELAGYRKTLAQPYLTDKDVNEKLLNEAYDRMKTEVRASHILVKCAENALPKDTLAAYTKTIEIRDRIVGKKDVSPASFESMAKAQSEDPSAKDNAGDLGYFTSLQMVYPFENVCYTAKIGEVSMPVRTRYGYHLIKVVDRRPAQGELLVAHIMIKTPKGGSTEDSINARKKIEEIYQKVLHGEDFSALAKQYSDDKGSASKGGELRWFGTNGMPPDFEKVAFSLQKNGDVSQIFKTKYGWHIMKRIDKRGLQPFEELKADIKSKVSKDSRSQMGRTAKIAQIKTAYNFSEIPGQIDPFYKAVDSTFFLSKWKAPTTITVSIKKKTKQIALDKPMFKLDGKTYTQQDFAAYLESHQVRKVKSEIKPIVDKLYKQFVDETVIACEESNLDKKYPEFRALMQEYRDGILLFDLTDKKVWSKAVNDTTGLKAFYEKNKQNYLWGERAEASVYTCANQKIAKEVRALIKKKKTDQQILEIINKNSQLDLQVDSKKFLKAENDYVASNFKVGISADKVENNKVVFVNVKQLLPVEPKTLVEAKGLVTADYQSYLEKEWIDVLKQKYPVTINKDVLSTLH